MSGIARPKPRGPASNASSIPRRRWLWLAPLVLVLAASACSGADPAPEPPSTPAPAASPTPATAAVAPAEASLTSEQGAALVEALRRGGHVLLFRHAITDSTQGDDLSALLLAGNDGGRVAIDGLRADCTRQRNLNQAGRDQARAIGAEFERLAIPHQVTLASPFCRTQETAGLAFGRYRIEEGISLIVGNDADGAAASAVKALLGQRPPPGSNVILVSHLSNITAAGLNLIAEGDCIVVRPEGTRWTVLAYVKAADWQRF